MEKKENELRCYPIHIRIGALLFEGAFLSLPCMVALIYREARGIPFFAVMLLCFFVGFLLSHKKPQNMQYYAKEGFVAVALSWILLSFGVFLLYLMEISHLLLMQCLR